MYLRGLQLLHQLRLLLIGFHFHVVELQPEFFAAVFVSQLLALSFGRL